VRVLRNFFFSFLFYLFFYLFFSLAPSGSTRRSHYVLLSSFVVIVLDGLWSWHFASQGNPCRCFPTKVATLRSCLYELFDI